MPASRRERGGLRRRASTTIPASGSASSTPPRSERCRRVDRRRRCRRGSATVRRSRRRGDQPAAGRRATSARSLSTGVVGSRSLLDPSCRPAFGRRRRSTGVPIGSVASRSHRCRWPPRCRSNGRPGRCIVLGGVDARCTRPAGSALASACGDAARGAAGGERWPRRRAARAGQRDRVPIRMGGRRRPRRSRCPTAWRPVSSARRASSGRPRLRAPSSPVRSARARRSNAVDRVGLLEGQPMSSRPLSRRCLISASISNWTTPPGAADLLASRSIRRLAGLRRPPGSAPRRARPAAGRSSCSWSRRCRRTTAR